MTQGIDGLQDLKRAVRALDRTERTLQIASIRAANRTLTHINKVASQGIRKQINLKAKVLKNALGKKRATFREPTAILSVEKGERKNAIPLHQFGARALKRGGISIAVKKGRRVKSKKLFLVDRGRVKVVARGLSKAEQGTTGKKLAFPYGPSADQLFKNDIRAKAKRSGEEFYERDLHRQLTFEVQKEWTRR